MIANTKVTATKPVQGAELTLDKLLTDVLSPFSTESCTGVLKSFHDSPRCASWYVFLCVLRGVSLRSPRLEAFNRKERREFAESAEGLIVRRSMIAAVGGTVGLFGVARWPLLPAASDRCRNSSVRSARRRVLRGLRPGESSAWLAGLRALCNFAESWQHWKTSE